jgi:D-sedoheptulose 7-phosphate isomerase
LSATDGASAALTDAILRKARESAATKERFFAENAPRIAACAAAMARAFEAGGRLHVMGNGGSACDAQHVAVEFMHPIIEKRRPLPARTIGNEVALLTAVSNDRDFALAYAQELRMHARAGDMALAISTSGKSASVNRALQAARELGLLTVGFSGRDGGRMVELCDHVFVVGSFSTHRIQETHETLLHVLWDLIHVILGEEDVI